MALVSVGTDEALASINRFYRILNQTFYHPFFEYSSSNVFIFKHICNILLRLYDVSIDGNRIEESFLFLRSTLKNFLLSVKQPDGGFALHVGGEVDIRGSYCALSIASITNILDDELRKNADSWIVR